MNIKGLTSIIVVLASSSVVFAQEAKDCKHRIVLLPQSHASVLGGSLEVHAEDADQIGRSQFAIAKFLAKNRSLPVFSEQVSTDQSMTTVSADFRAMAEHIKSKFPHGLPEKFERLSAEQKEFISKAGGDALNLILGVTPLLRRVVENDQIAEDLIGKISAWAQQNPDATTAPAEIMNIIFPVREKLALDQINTFFKANRNQKDVILIYGSDHSYTFRTHPDKFPPNCIVIPTEFQAKMTSPYSQAPADSGYGGYSYPPGTK